MSKLNNDQIRAAKKYGGSETQQIIADLIFAKACGNEEVAAELERRYLKKTKEGGLK